MNECRTWLTRRRRSSRFVPDDQLGRIASEEGSNNGHGVFGRTPPFCPTSCRRCCVAFPTTIEKPSLLKHAERMEYTQMAGVTRISFSAFEIARQTRMRDVAPIIGVPMTEEEQLAEEYASVYQAYAAIPATEPEVLDATLALAHGDGQ